MSRKYTPILRTCELCGEEFDEYRSAEEKMLDAIFGHKYICRKCREEGTGVKCTKCGQTVWDPVYSNNLPYHAGHLPYS